jgi:hypothetical protein
MFTVKYDTSITKNILWVVVCAMSECEAVWKAIELVGKDWQGMDIEVTDVYKFF